VENLSGLQFAKANTTEAGTLTHGDRALRLPQVREITGLGRSMIYQM